MRCDNWDGGCRIRSDIRPTTEALPLEEFAAAGWYIAKTHGDRCPSCVAAAGGMAALQQDARQPILTRLVMRRMMAGGGGKP